MLLRLRAHTWRQTCAGRLPPRLDGVVRRAAHLGSARSSSRRRHVGRGTALSCAEEVAAVTRACPCYEYQYVICIGNIRAGRPELESATGMRDAGMQPRSRLLQAARTTKHPATYPSLRLLWLGR